MDLRAMEPFGRSLVAWLEGDRDATLTVERDDGVTSPLPAAHFFRDEPDFTPLERAALACCRGRVLDIGAGAGSLSLTLQRRGLVVTALDISPDAVAVCARRGVTDPRCADIATFADGPFDTLVMLGHGIGMVETVEGLRRFLRHARGLLAPGGQLLLDSMDVLATRDPAHLAYHEANRRAGRYVGEIRMRFAFRGEEGPFCGWLQVDAGTLGAHAREAGWTCDVLERGAHGDYLAHLTPA